MLFETMLVMGRCGGRFARSHKGSKRVTFFPLSHQDNESEIVNIVRRISYAPLGASQKSNRWQSWKCLSLPRIPLRLETVTMYASKIKRREIKFTENIGSDGFSRTVNGVLFPSLSSSTNMNISWLNNDVSVKLLNY